MKVIYCSLVNCAAPRTWCGVLNAGRWARAHFDDVPYLKIVKPDPPVIRVICSCSVGGAS